MSNLELLNEIEKENKYLKRYIDPIRSLLVSDSELSFNIQEIKKLYKLMKSEEPSSEKHKKYEEQLKSFFIHISKSRGRRPTLGLTEEE